MLGLSFITWMAWSTILLPSGLSIALLKSNCGPCSVTSGSALAGGGADGGAGAAQRTAQHRDGPLAVRVAPHRPASSEHEDGRNSRECNCLLRPFTHLN